MRLTKATTESICEAIENGHAVRFSCAFAGVSQRSYFRWRTYWSFVIPIGIEGRVKINQINRI